jgi:hypothetical protein
MEVPNIKTTAAIRHRWPGAFQQFRRKITRSSGRACSLAGVGGRNGQSKIGDAGATLAINHHVRRLQIPMQHSTAMSGGEPCTQLLRDLNCFVFSQASDAPQQRLSNLVCATRARFPF